MELLLNLVWVLIAGTALSWHLRSAPKDRKQFLLALGALCCALLLLFPTISVSDDLHVQAIVTEDSSPTKRLASAITHAAPVYQIAIFFVFSALVAALFRTVCFVRTTTPAPYLSALLDRPVLGRAPPALSLA
ncbi:MAG TPA: hypothetical protein VF786_12930 [Terriglobales bacterium]